LRLCWPARRLLTQKAIPTYREYRLVQLPNKLDVILVSDPETQTAAAAVSVSAGQLQDPTEVQGLAHFCEHMLFLGSQKFPDESDFDSFCAQSAGYSNAWTSMDRTVYHFMLAHNQLYGALDKFSGFFTSPLFTEDLTERELNAVDSENNKNLQVYMYINSCIHIRTLTHTYWRMQGASTSRGAPPCKK